VRPTPRQDDRPPSCPPWCRRDHPPDDGAEDGADDLLHQSAPTFAVVVHGDPRFGPVAHPTPDVVVLRLVRRDGSDEVWLEAASEEGRALHLLVSAESASRLVSAMTALLDVR
jgi:hypothetical protein